MKKIKSKIRAISILIPVYNESDTIATIVDRVKKADTMGLKKEIIVINDGSTDQTGRIIRKIKGIVSISHIKNRGKGAALRTGFLRSTGDIVLIQDADFEYSPDDYPHLIEPFLNSQADAVFGSRFRGSESRRVFYFSHHLANQILTFLSDLLTNINLTDMECGFKAFNRPVVDQIKKKLVSNRFGIEPELVARVAKIPSIRIFEIGVHYQGRTYAEGKKIGFMDGIKAIIEIIRFNVFA
jgi:glycosyltransferase involved in cell wall biosynthesis